MPSPMPPLVGCASKHHFAILLAAAALSLTGSAVAERRAVPGGEFAPVIAPSPTQSTTRVAAFRLDEHPVTNAEFLKFVTVHPEWQRGNVPALFADERYLGHWRDALNLGESRPNAPVIDVSWHAARAYCAAAGGRLPTWYEWEFAAAADETRADARQDTAWRERILAWSAQSAAHPPGDVEQSPADIHGIHDLHGLVWEWVDDFGALMVSGDSRDQGDPDKLKFCGAGALAASIRDDYPVLMRIALLSSLEADHSVASLGFRCAEDMP